MIDSNPHASPASRSTRSQSQVAAALTELREGAARLAASPSHFGGLGSRARVALLRVTRPLVTRQALVDEKLLSALDALAFDTSIAQRAATSFPEPLDPSSVLDVETRIGKLFVHAQDRVMTPLIQQHGEWESDEAAFLARSLRPGDTFLDVGANFGYFSVLGASLVGASGSVIAVEPEGRNLALLKANLWRHSCATAVVLPLAAGREQGFVPLCLNEENRGDHQTGLAGRPDQLVPSARLDDLLGGRRVDCIKIDTQGSDHDVVAGLSQVIRSGRSTVLCEFWPPGIYARGGIEPLEVAEEYCRAGYRLHLLGEQSDLRPVDPSGLVAAARTDPREYVNVVLTRDP